MKLPLALTTGALMGVVVLKLPSAMVGSPGSCTPLLFRSLKMCKRLPASPVPLRVM